MLVLGFTQEQRLGLDRVVGDPLLRPNLPKISIRSNISRYHFVLVAIFWVFRKQKA